MGVKRPVDAVALYACFGMFLVNLPCFRCRYLVLHIVYSSLFRQVFYIHPTITRQWQSQHVV
jgi:hypothetical protein